MPSQPILLDPLQLTAAVHDQDMVNVIDNVIDIDIDIVNFAGHCLWQWPHSEPRLHAGLTAKLDVIDSVSTLLEVVSMRRACPLIDWHCQWWKQPLVAVVVVSGVA